MDTHQFGASGISGEAITAKTSHPHVIILEFDYKEST